MKIAGLSNAEDAIMQVDRYGSLVGRRIANGEGYS
jgi:hypothetical protein